MSERRKSPIELEPVEPHMCTVEVRLEILSRVPFFSGLKPHELDAVNAMFVERGYTAGEYLYHEGDPAERLYVVADGRVKLLRHGDGEKDVLLDLLVPGEYFGSLSFEEDDEYTDTALAHTPVCSLSIDRQRFRQILDRYPDVALRVLRILNRRLLDAQEAVRMLSALPVDRRIAHTLLKLAAKLGKQQAQGILIETPLSRDDLAQMTGATTETVSRVLSQFQKEGLIESGRQWVAISDRDRLVELAGEGMT